jgi:PAS domain S-box-containing protein
MLKNLKIGTQIGLGFGLILILSVLMVAFAIRGLQSGSTSFKAYRRLARASLLSGRVQANMLTASNAAKDFLNTRDEKYLEVFQVRFQAARTFALEQQTAIEDPARRDMSQQLVNRLESYRTAAEEVFGLMLRRDAILQETLNPQGVRMRKNLTEIMVSAYQDNDSEAAYVAGRALERVLLGRLYVLKFLEDNKESDTERVQAELGRGFKQALAEMVKAIENPHRKELLQDFSAARDIYVSAFKEIVTTISDRNTVITQRMEPLERSVADISEQIKLSLKVDQDTLGPQVQESKDKTVRAVLIGSAVAIGLAIVIGLSIIRAITRPIAELVETVGTIQASGDLTQRLKILSTNEIGIMAKALNDFLATLEGQAGVAANVARGVFSADILPRSAEDTLGTALQRMTATLRDNAADAALQDWTQNGQSKVNDASRGTLDEGELGARLILALSEHLDAQLGALYVFREDSSRLQFISGYAVGDETTQSPDFGIGEGLVGQAARDRKPMLIEQVPEDYCTIRSSLGQSAPCSLVVFPLVHDDRLMGVVELAFMIPVDDRQVRFLSSVEENICIAMRAAQSQVELHNLLTHTKQQAIFFRVFKDATDPIVLEDLSGDVMDLNAAAEQAYGWTKEELVGKPIKRIVPEDRRDQADQLLHECLEGGSVRNVEGLRISRDGTVYDVLITLSLLRDENEELIGIASIAKDITSLQQARAAADTANQAKSDFLANMSHEIRTPMNGIIGMTELALDTDLDPEQRDYLETVKSSAESLLTLINDILDFSKIEAGKLEIEPIDFELRDALADMLSTLASRAHHKGLELAYHVPPEIQDALIGDVHRLQQIIVNLVGNAIKFTPQGEIVVSIKQSKCTGQEIELQFSVQDTGVGIPAEKLEAIFKPFEQADVSTTREYGGTGLGLAISVQLVELMGGRIWAESVEGQGSTFHFTIRLGAGAARATSKARPSPELLEGLPVLIVDDNQTNRRILEEIFRNWRMSPHAVPSGADAMAALESAAKAAQPFRLVISDVNMPEMDGFQLFEHIHRQNADVPVILMTSGARTGDVARCRELGVAAHLTKPAKQSLLMNTIATVVAGPGSDGSPIRQQQDEPKQTEQRQATPPAGEAESPRALRLLLAEDNQVNQKFAVRAIEKAGHSVVVANNGREAVDTWQREAFDVILMDIQMPEVDGYEATSTIRKLEREQTANTRTPIIAMTANAMKGDKERCLETGMDGYVSKPVKRKLLFAEIERVLGIV